MADLEAFKAQMHVVASRMTSGQALDWTRLPHIQVPLRVWDALRVLGVRSSCPERPDPGTALAPR